MAEYVSNVEVDFDGEALDDFDEFTEGEQDVAVEVPLMNKTGFTGMTARYRFNLNYVVPEVGEIDFRTKKDGTCTIEYENGKRIVYTGVRALKIGETKHKDGEPSTRAIDFGATGMTPE